jgi:hypothetical protein
MKIIAASWTLYNGCQRYNNTQQDNPDYDHDTGRFVGLCQLQSRYRYWHVD